MIRFALLECLKDLTNDTLAVSRSGRKRATYTDCQVLFQRRRYRT